MKPVISRTTGSSPSSSSTSIILSSAPFDPESGSEAPSFASNSRGFSIRKPTFSVEIVNSGMLHCSLAARCAWPDNAQAREMIHCARVRKPASFAPRNEGYRDQGKKPDALEHWQGQNHENRRTGNGGQHAIHPTARHQRGNPQTALADSRFRDRR